MGDSSDSARRLELEMSAIVERVKQARRIVLLLDYDGTLIELAGRPQDAGPSEELLDLLRSLAALPGVIVRVVSGRDRHSLEAWLGDLPIGLHAEHGLWSRVWPDTHWTVLREVDTRWKQRLRGLLKDFVSAVPGALIEEKTAALAWHYRQAETEAGSTAAERLRLRLSEVLADEPVEILAGSKVIEIRAAGVHKGGVVRLLLANVGEPRPLVIAMGDDRTDEDLFAALPDDGIAIHVGTQPTQARHRLANPAEARALLRHIVQARRSGGGGGVSSN